MADLTPMMRQYLEIKEQNKDSILFFRLGDFYEMFNEDAKLAARELDLTLTSRDRSKPKEEQTPMCGVPYHSVDSYIARLVQKGYKVAICEQMEDPALAKGLVERDITRIVTPGTVTESCMLDESKNNYMGCLYGEGGRFGLAFCDVSTGAFFVTLCADAQSVASDLGRFSPSEVMRFGTDVSSEAIEDALFRRLNCCVDEGKDGQFSLEDCEALLEKHFSQSLAQMGLAGMPAAVVAAGALLRLDAKNGWRIWRRDRRNHASPTSAQTETVCAGLHGVRLAGDAYYHGELHKKPYIGDALREIEYEDIPRAGRLLYATAALSLVLFGAVRFLLVM